MTSHPFTVQCAPWTGRSVTIPRWLSIIQWSLSIHRPCKTTTYRFISPVEGVGFALFSSQWSTTHCLTLWPHTSYLRELCRVQNKEMKLSSLMAGQVLNHRKTWLKPGTLLFESICGSGKLYTTFQFVSWCANSSIVLNFLIAIMSLTVYILLIYWQKIIKLNQTYQNYQSRDSTKFPISI